MSRNVFGWSLPPGVTNRMIEDAAGGYVPCDCCGRHDDDCVCPECPTCGAVGDPECYNDLHGTLTYSNEQLIGRAELKIAQLEQQLYDERYALELLKERLDAEKRAADRIANHVDGYDRDDLGESPDY